jgi:hypothetical protein
MKSRLTPVGLLFAAIALVMICGYALAFFSTTGTGTASAAVGQLTTPTLTATPAVGGKVTLSWTAATVPGGGTVKYFVERDGGPAGGNCATEASPTTATTCGDTAVTPGEHEYTVTAVFRSWQQTSAVAKATVEVGAVSRFSIEASSTTPAAGTAVNLTITAQDENGSTVSNYTGSHTLVFSGASASPAGNQPTVAPSSSTTGTNFGSNTAITFTAGVSSVTSSKNGVLKIFKAGEANVNASEGAITDPTPLKMTVAPAATSKFTMTADTATLNAGGETDLTITAFDTYGNLATAYEGSKNIVFSGAAATAGGNASTVANASGVKVNFGTATPILFTAGVAEGGEGKNGTATLYKSGTLALKAAEGSITNATAATVTVSPLTTTKFGMTASPTTVAAGAETNLTITAQDTYGNTTPTYAGSKSIVFSGAAVTGGGTASTVADSSGTDIPFGTATPIQFTSGVATPTTGKNGAATLYKSGSNALKATEGSLTNPTATTVTVTAGAAVGLTMTGSPASVAAGGTETLTLTALDVYGNTATGYTGTKNIVFSGAGASPLANEPTVTNASSVAINFGQTTTVAFSNGVKAVSAKLYGAGSASVSATDGTFTTNAVPLTVTYGAASRVAWLNVTASAGTVVAGCFVTCTVNEIGNGGTVKGNLEIIDLYGNVVSNYGSSKTGTVTASTGTVTGGSLTFPATGPAVSPTQFTYTYPASGSTAATLTGASTSRTSVTATVNK